MASVETMPEARIRTTESELSDHPSGGNGHKSEINVGTLERVVSGVGGGVLAAAGVRLLLLRNPWAGLLMMAVGGGLANRGVSGRCAVYKALGFHHEDASFSSNPLSREVGVYHGVTVDRPADELYSWWRDFSNLPKVMPHLRRVEVFDDTHSHWVMEGPGESEFEWDSVVTGDSPNQMISWSSTGDSPVRTRGTIWFVRATGDRGTVVRVEMRTHLPGGFIGAAVAKITGQDPVRQTWESLRMFKQLMEAGEFATVRNQPHGSCR